jgi:hypothetical protein
MSNRVSDHSCFSKPLNSTTRTAQAPGPGASTTCLLPPLAQSAVSELHDAGHYLGEIHGVEFPAGGPLSLDVLSGAQHQRVPFRNMEPARSDDNDSLGQTRGRNVVKNKTHAP